MTIWDPELEAALRKWHRLKRAASEAAISAPGDRSADTPTRAAMIAAERALLAECARWL